MAVVSIKNKLRRGNLLVGNDPYIPTDYESIATVSVGSGGAADVEFTSIPGTYTHLQIRWIARSARAGQLFRCAMPQGCCGGPRGQACFAEFSFDFGFLREGSESQRSQTQFAQLVLAYGFLRKKSQCPKSQICSLQILLAFGFLPEESESQRSQTQFKQLVLAYEFLRGKSQCPKFKSNCLLQVCLAFGFLREESESQRSQTQLVHAPLAFGFLPEESGDQRDQSADFRSSSPCFAGVLFCIWNSVLNFSRNRFHLFLRGSVRSQEVQGR